MISITRSTTIQKPQSEVFSFLTDPDNYTKWVEDLKSFTTSGKPLISGTEFEQYGIFKGKEIHCIGIIKEVIHGEIISLGVSKVIAGPKV